MTPKIDTKYIAHYDYRYRDADVNRKFLKAEVEAINTLEWTIYKNAKVIDYQGFLSIEMELNKEGVKYFTKNAGMFNIGFRTYE